MIVYNNKKKPKTDRVDELQRNYKIELRKREIFV